MCGEWTSSFAVTLPLGSCIVPLPVSPAGSNYPVDQDLPKVVLNAAHIVKCLEQTLVPEAERLWGRAPKWFAHEYLRDKTI